ncbi:HigA family addiction module antitoxin [Lentisalinibacter salinarum]|uniref:HigA family addiction module antitoxin n=1 Tax=Lentisalinibacter salinarum TaxID=2992239 RepID=UPI00386C0844
MSRRSPIHPGEILKEEFLEELDLSAYALAKALKVPTNRITGILNGDRAITADTALRLSRYFGNSPEFWLNLQARYDLELARRLSGDRIRKEVATSAAAV